MLTQSKFCFLLVSSTVYSPNTEKLLLQLSVWDDELLSIPKIITFLERSLSKLHETAPLNCIP